MKRIIRSLLLILFTGAMLHSCCACRRGSPQIGSLEADNWKLIELQDQAIPEEQAVTLSFDANAKTLRGIGVCGIFFANYSLFDKPENIRITSTGFSSRTKACRGTEPEDLFVSALAGINRIKIEGDKLLMLDVDGNLAALFTSIPKTAE